MSSHSMFVVNNLTTKVSAEISLKSHAFEDPDHFLIATAFCRNPNYAVYLWDTIGIGNRCSSDRRARPLFIDFH